jgi:hypothetical protein
MDWHIKKQLYPDTPVQDYARTFMPVMALVDQKKINTNSTGVFDNLRFDKDTAYHFDAVKFARDQKDKLSEILSKMTKEEFYAAFQHDIYDEENEYFNWEKERKEFKGKSKK